MEEFPISTHKLLENLQRSVQGKVRRRQPWTAPPDERRPVQSNAMPIVLQHRLASTLTRGLAAGPGAQVEAELKRAGMLRLLPELLEANATSGKQVVELVAAAGQMSLPGDIVRTVKDGGEGVVPAHVTKLTPKQQEVGAAAAACASVLLCAACRADGPQSRPDLLLLKSQRTARRIAAADRRQPPAHPLAGDPAPGVH